MKKYILMVLVTILSMPSAMAQTIQQDEGSCGVDAHWSFDGYTLAITNVNKKGQYVMIDDYDTKKNLAPWVKRKLPFKKLVIGQGIVRIGSCAFANCTELRDVEFMDQYLVEIGWGAFLNCSRLRTMSLPVKLRAIETIAFANCSSLTSVKIPDQCRVGDQAFVSCSNLNSIEVGPTAILGHYVFASEVKIDNVVRHSLYNGEIRRIPSYVNANNCHEFGLAKVPERTFAQVDYDYPTADVDSVIPVSDFVRSNTYALIIGNQNYRFVSDVPYAIHDARVFGEYCKKTLGIPVENVHISEDATKTMILEEELEGWLQQIPNRQEKKLLVYYAGHGVPDVKDGNKAYLLPTDVRGTSPSRGIALDRFYDKLNDLAFNQTSVFLDACFSGVNRDDEGVVEGERGVAVRAKDEAISGNGSMVVFAAAQGNETAQGYPEQGHGLFTYYLIKEIQKNEFVSFGELSDNLKENVSKGALQQKMRKAQTPTTNPSGSVADTWRSFSF